MWQVISIYKMSFKVTFSLIFSVILTACAQNDGMLSTILTNRQNDGGEYDLVDYEHDTNDYQNDTEAYAYDYYGNYPERESVLPKIMDKALAAIYGIIAIVGLVANGVVFFVVFGRNEISKQREIVFQYFYSTTCRLCLYRPQSPHQQY